MQISHNTEAQRQAKVAITRPEVLVAEILSEDKDTALKTIHALRVYPHALINLMRADNMPKWMKAICEGSLEEVGFLMMT